MSFLLRRSLLVAPLALAAVGLYAPAADACGGFFPQNEIGAPVTPVDQRAARMIFAVDRAAGRVCAHLQMSYRGAPGGFAWIVPVPAEPSIGESAPALFGAIGLLVGLRVVPPSPDASTCPDPDDDELTCGCGGDASGSKGGGGDGFLAPGPTGPVTVYAEVQTQNYDAVVVGAEGDAGADALVIWLQDNGYRFSDNMRPVVQAYVDEGMLFAAFKLRDTADATETAPIVLCYDAAAPAVPLRMAAVAAAPMTSLSVTVVSDVTFTVAGGEALAPDPEGIVFDPVTGRTNYFEWMARAADEADGRAWVLDFAGSHGLTTALPGSESNLSAYPWMTHFTTRLSPRHMAEDAVFAPTDGQTYRDAVIDLSGQRGIPLCGELEPPAPCYDTYCGLGAECVDTLEKAYPHCLCAAGDVAQAVVGPDGEVRATCTPPTNPLGLAADVETTLDPCASLDCGEGECVVVAGFGACRCAEGAGAFIDSIHELRCETLSAGELRRYGPGGGPESAPGGTTMPETATEGLTAAPRPLSVPASAPWLGALLAGRWLVRRRRGASGRGGA